MLAQPSVQSLFIAMQVNGQGLSTGTAFVVATPKGPHLITNRHNVTGRHQETSAPLSPTGGLPTDIVVVHNKKGSLGTWVERIEPLFANGKPRWVEHPTLGDKADVVALPLSDLADVELYPYDLANPGPDLFIAPADTVSVIGFPFGLTAGGVFGVWATGFVASEPDVNFNNLPVLLIDCRSRPGQSGSPVICFRNGGMIPLVGGGAAHFGGPVWRLVGVYSGRVHGESDLGIVWKLSVVQELVAAL